MMAAEKKSTGHQRHRNMTDRERIELAAGWRRFIELIERIHLEEQGEPLVRVVR